MSFGILWPEGRTDSSPQSCGSGPHVALSLKGRSAWSLGRSTEHEGPQSLRKCQDLRKYHFGQWLTHTHTVAESLGPFPPVLRVPFPTSIGMNSCVWSVFNISQEEPIKPYSHAWSSSKLHMGINPPYHKFWSFLDSPAYPQLYTLCKHE